MREEKMASFSLLLLEFERETPWPPGFRRGRGTSKNRKVTENINPTEVEQLSANRRPKSKGLQDC